MPGNKNSGRRKSTKQNVPRDDDDDPIQKRKKKPGRPKKEVSVVVSDTEQKRDDKTETQSLQSSGISTFHPSNLQKRSSDMNKVYDSFLGPPLQSLPSSKLPQQRTILQRYRALRTESGHTAQLNDIITTITKEARELWEFSCIPMKNYRGCWDMVKQCVTMWLDTTKQDTRKSSKFQDKLNTLLDFRPVIYRTLSSLKQALVKSGNPNWIIDYEFFKGQLTHPQTSTMSSRRDVNLKKNVETKAIKEAKSLSFMEKNIGDYPCTSLNKLEKETKAHFYHTLISEDNILEISPRQCALEVPNENSSTSSSQEELSNNDSDVDWDVPLRLERKLKKKTENITLNLPPKMIPTILAETCTTTKTSTRNELKLVSTLLKAGGADMHEASISLSTIHRQRKVAIQSHATEIRKTFKNFKDLKSTEKGTFLVLHWDSKIIQLMDGKTEDRLAIAVSSPCNIPGQFIASPAIANGTGDTMAKCVFNIVNNYEMTDDVEAVVFDTTASNTGRWRGSTTLFEIMLQRSLLWLACRHHIPELFIKHANTAIRGPSKGPDDSLFKEFKEGFGFINLEDRTLWKWPNSARDWRHRRASEVLVWADRHMQRATWPREDYRELLELVVTYLGGVVKRLRGGEVINIPLQVRKPGAIHRARFMASCLYLLKICLYQKQFQTEAQNIHDAMILGEYIALLHAPYFLKSPLAISAPRNDRDLWVDLGDYEKCFRLNMRENDMIAAVKESMLNHLWYLTQELVVFGLFDKDLPINERQAMAKKLSLIPCPATFPPAKPQFPVDLMTATPKMESFVGERRWLLFNKMDAVGDWLSKNVDEWEGDNEYRRLQNCLQDLKVVNDLAERCIKDIQEYADLAKDSQYQEDILIVARDHRGVFQDLRKQALVN